jgi:hypothetical protein
VPQPIELSGEGQQVTDPVQLPSRINRVFFTHDGARNFIVQAYKASGETDYLMNAIGRYAGICPLLANEPVFFVSVSRVL